MAAAKGKPKAKRAATAKVASAAGDRVGRGTRWSEEQVKLLLDTVKGSATAKEAFEAVAKQLGKSTGTVQQKYYNLQKKAGGGSGRRGRRPPRRHALPLPLPRTRRDGRPPPHRRCPAPRCCATSRWMSSSASQRA